MSDLIRKHKIFFGIIVALVVLAVSLTVVISQQQQSLKQHAGTTSKDVSVVLNPSSKSLSAGGDLFVIINIDNPNLLEISAVDINLTYPSDLLSYDSLTLNENLTPITKAPSSGSFHLVAVNEKSTSIIPIDPDSEEPEASIYVGTLKFKASSSKTGPASVAFSPAKPPVISASGHPLALEVNYEATGTYTITAAAGTTAPPPSGTCASIDDTPTCTPSADDTDCSHDDFNPYCKVGNEIYECNDEDEKILLDTCPTTPTAPPPSACASFDSIPDNCPFKIDGFSESDWLCSPLPLGTKCRVDQDIYQCGGQYWEALTTCPKVNGACSDPQAHYACKPGSTSDLNVATTSQWTWQCNGSYGGTPASCFELGPILGVCGTAKNSNSYTAPATNLCSSGTPTTIAGSGPWTWSCNGSPGGTNDTSCVANKSIDGACGTDPTTCSAGDYIAIADSDPVNYKWKCMGKYEGTDVLTCYKPKPVNGVCKTSVVNGCEPGTPIDIGGDAANYTWKCNGLNGGDSSLACSKAKPIADSKVTIKGHYVDVSGYIYTYDIKQGVSVPGQTPDLIDPEITETNTKSIVWGTWNYTGIPAGTYAVTATIPPTGYTVSHSLCTNTTTLSDGTTCHTSASYISGNIVSSGSLTDTNYADIYFKYTAIGDLTSDGKVNKADYDIWVLQYGKTGVNVADLNDDKIVNILDFNIWKAGSKNSAIPH